MQKTKILIVSLAYAPFVGGAELAVQEITKRISGYDFDLITYRFDSRWLAVEQMGNTTVYRVGFGRLGVSYYGRTLEKFIFIPLAFWKAVLLHRKNKYKIFWSLMASRASAVVLGLKFLFPRVPFFLTIQEGDTPAYAHARAGFFLPLWRLVFKCADKIQAISNYLRDFCVAEGALSENIEVIPNGVDIELFSKKLADSERDEIRQKLNIKTGAKVIVSASRLVHKNGIDILLRAVNIIKDKGADIVVLLLGSGPEQVQLKNYAKEHALRVVFVGDVLQRELPKYFSISNIFIRPSRSEGLGSAFLEAMVAGLPVIATPVGGIPDFLKDKKTGIFSESENEKDLAEKILLLFNDEKLRSEIAIGGQKLVISEYDWNHIAQKFSAIFDAFAEQKNIVLATGVFPPDIGGPATYSAILMNALPKRGYKISCVTYGDSKIENSVICVGKNYFKGIRHLLFFYKVCLAARKADIILSADASFGAGLPAFLAAKFSGKRFIVRVTGEYSWEQSSLRFGVTDSLDEFQHKRYGFFVEIMRMIEHWLVRRADIIIVPSNYLKTIVLGWGVLENKVRLVYNAYEESAEVLLYEKILRAEAREKLNLPDSAKIIVSAGRLVPWKGVSALLESFARVHAHNPDAKLYIIGDGPDRKNLEQRTKNLELKDDVVFTGSVSKADLALYLRSANVFALNSLYEGFSHQLLEVLKLGVPFIASDIIANRDVIGNAESGILVRYNDIAGITSAIENILKDTELQIQDSVAFHKARSIADKFSADRMADELVKIL